MVHLFFSNGTRKCYLCNENQFILRQQCLYFLAIKITPLNSIYIKCCVFKVVQYLINYGILKLTGREHRAYEYSFFSFKISMLLWHSTGVMIHTTCHLVVFTRNQFAPELVRLLVCSSRLVFHK